MRQLDEIKMQVTLDGAVPRNAAAFQIDLSRLIPDAYICAIISTYLTACSKARGRILKPGEELSLSGTGSRYFQYLSKTLGIANDCIRGTGPWARSIGGFSPIINMFDSDIGLNGSTWQAHANGLFTYIDRSGGIYTVLSPESWGKRYRGVMMLM